MLNGIKAGNVVLLIVSLINKYMNMRLRVYLAKVDINRGISWTLAF